jgi:DNA-directed RNA polymerase omega subunit
LDNLEGIDSQFRLAILAARRAKQLVNGAKPKIEISAENPISIAIEEINRGLINFHILEQTEQEELSRGALFKRDDAERENEDIDDLLLEADTDDFDEEDEDEYEVEEEEEDEDDDDNDEEEDEDEDDEVEEEEEKEKEEEEEED